MWLKCLSVHFLHDPLLKTLMLHRNSIDNFVEQRRRDKYRAIGIDNDHIVGEYRHTATTHGLLPIDKRESRYRSRGGSALAPDRQAGVKHARQVARVEIGAPHEAGVARSSRAGTKRSVKARPT